MQTHRMISVKNFPKKSVDKNPLTTTQDVLKIIYHASLIGGVVLCMCYFTIYADGLPALGDISQLLGLLVATCSIAFAMIGCFTFLMVFPSSLAFTFSQKANRIKPLQLFFRYISIPFFAIFVYYEIGQEPFHNALLLEAFIALGICLLCCWNNEEHLFFGYSTLLVVVSLILSIICVNKTWLLLAFLFPLIYQMLHSKPFYKLNLGESLFYMYIIGIYCIAIILVYLFLNVDIGDDKKTYYISVALVYVAILIANVFILKQNENLRQKNKYLKTAVQSVLLLFFISFFLFIYISSLYSRPNPLIVNPFNIAKLGYYPAELHFKEEFIQNTNFFNMKDKNITSNVFFILNSIGDEYIVRERSPIFFVDDNMSLSAIAYNNTIYWYDKDNNKTVYTFKDFHFQRTDEVNASTLKETFNKDKTKKYTNTQVYRIKKEDVIYETNGKGFDQRNTVVYGQ